MMLESSRMGITAECYQHPAATNHNHIRGIAMTANNSTISPAQPVTVFPTSKSKVCTRCKVDKPFSEFSPQKSSKFGLRSFCKPCRSSRDRELHAADPEKRRTSIARTSARWTPEQEERHRIRKVRNGMIQRCHNPNNTAYKNYGGRGITVCKRWRGSLDDFISDMGPCPTGYQIDRTDNQAGYSPENCRWVTPAENNQNQRTRSTNKTGIAGVCASGYSNYRAHIIRNGIIRQKSFTDFFEACCYRKSLENQFNNTGEI